jgi:hypothetical protein
MILLNINRKNTNTVAEGRILPNIRETFQMVLTFLLFVTGMVFFRSESMNAAFAIFGKIINIKSYSLMHSKDIEIYQNLALIFVMIAVEWVQRTKQHAMDLSVLKSHVLKYAIYIMVIALIFMFYAHSQAFIYFQF